MKIAFLTCALVGVIIDIACGALDTTKIDQITGLKGKFNEKEGVYRVSFPRSDVKVAVDGWTVQSPQSNLGDSFNFAA